MTRNAQLFERAQRVIPGGVNSPVRAFRQVGGTPRFIDRAEGAYMIDAEGTRFSYSPFCVESDWCTFSEGCCTRHGWNQFSGTKLY